MVKFHARHREIFPSLPERTKSTACWKCGTLRCQDHGSEFIGERGTIIVDRAAVRWFPKDEDDSESGPSETLHGKNTHWQNFVDCLKSRVAPRANIESLAKVTTLCHLGNISWQAQTTVKWDAKSQDISNRAARHAMAYEREYRKPWELKHYKA